MTSVRKCRLTHSADNLYTEANMSVFKTAHRDETAPLADFPLKVTRLDTFYVRLLENKQTSYLIFS